MTEQLQMAVSPDLSVAQYVELTRGPEHVFGGSAFASEEARVQAWREHGPRLVQVSNRSCWAARRYGEPT